MKFICQKRIKIVVCEIVKVTLLSSVWCFFLFPKTSVLQMTLRAGEQVWPEFWNICGFCSIEIYLCILVSQYVEHKSEKKGQKCAVMAVIVVLLQIKMICWFLFCHVCMMSFCELTGQFHCNLKLVKDDAYMLTENDCDFIYNKISWICSIRFPVLFFILY